MDADLNMLAQQVVREQRLDMAAGEALELARVAARALDGLSKTESRAMLLMLERLALAPSGGHRVTVRVGNDPAMNAPPCMVCRRPLDSADWSLRFSSYWEMATIWLCWHHECLAGIEVEQEFDMLAGDARSQLGLP